MKVNYVRKGTGTRTTIVIPDHLCQLWFATTPSDAVKRDTQRIKERLEQLDAPSEGEPFQRLAESALVADIEAYQARLLASGEQMKVRVIEALLPWLQGAVEPTASAGDVFKAIERFKSVPWEIEESFESLENQR
ncbi:hypothetical protein M2J86_24890 (plasmid) [Citrobacter freundii]|uniref:hypothetical protein n=1 Tax=Citrobacter TaxID=544 RepID=UPI000D9706F5|nr:MULTISPECIES: hypothetical protein [Citrobacter]EET7319307.1 hypothetical protein [Escherichia coli]DAL59476.1 MAG TPA_asm: hypothetical protein [Caudoviricetes sp.]ELE2066165.1 hypothetical protein [Citrobacter freundii]ELQ7923433.1 hypothetical protein [Citrobacter freundii]MBJ8798647.1 hypothetical protein [Citrobacter freundii]